MRSKLFFPARSIFLCLIVFAAVATAKADEPLPAPADHWVKSANGKYTAFFQVKENRTTVFEVVKSSRKNPPTKRWEMEGWFRNAYLSNDGANLIVFYNGANLLDLDFEPDEPMISFYERGKLLNQVRLNQLIKNPSPETLPKTVSHYRWVATYGLNEKQIFEVSTIEKKRFEFDIKTGLPIGTLLYAAAVEPAPRGDSSYQAKRDSQTNSAPTGQNGQTNSADTNSKTNAEKEIGGCRAAALGIVGCAVLSSILVGQRQI